MGPLGTRARYASAEYTGHVLAFGCGRAGRGFGGEASIDPLVVFELAQRVVADGGARGGDGARPTSAATRRGSCSAPGSTRSTFPPTRGS